MTKPIDFRGLISWEPIAWKPVGIPGLTVVEDDPQAWEDFQRLRAANPGTKFGLIADCAAPSVSHIRHEPIVL